MSGNNFDFHSFSTSVRQPCRRRPRSPRRISAWLARRRSFNGNNNFSPAFRACVNNRNGTRNLPDAMTSQSAHSRPRTPPHSTTVTHLAPSTVPTHHPPSHRDRASFKHISLAPVQKKKSTLVRIRLALRHRAALCKDPPQK